MSDDYLDAYAPIFRAAWHQADDEGRIGERVKDGLRAVLVHAEYDLWHLRECLSAAEEEVNRQRRMRLSLTNETDLPGDLAHMARERDSARRDARRAMDERDQERKWKEGNLRALSATIKERDAAITKLAILRGGAAGKEDGL